MRLYKITFQYFNTYWQVRLLAVDDGVPAKTSTTTLTVSVEDVNDNAPELIGATEFTVMEGELPGVVAYITAMDRDEMKSGHGPPFFFYLDHNCEPRVKAAFNVEQIPGKNIYIVIYKE